MLSVLSGLRTNTAVTLWSQTSQVVNTIQKRFASKKASGTSNNGRSSNPKYRGVKIYGGQFVIPGNIIVRQKGNRFWPGEGVAQGKDFTLYATEAGFVRFGSMGHTRAKRVTVIPAARYEELAKIKAYDRARRSNKYRAMIRPHWCPNIPKHLLAPLKNKAPSTPSSSSTAAATSTTTTTTAKN